MKKITTLTIASMLAGVAGLHAQAFTNPSGYVTHTLKTGQFNPIGLTLHEPVTVSGAFETVSGTTLTDDDVDFDSVLTDGTTYILEITSGTLSGTIQEVVWNSPSATNNIVTSDNLGSDGLVAADTYQIRAASTLQGVFGTPPELVSTAVAASSDLVWVPTASGSYDRYYYRTPAFGGTPEWTDATTGEAIGELPLVYTDGVFVQLRDTSPEIDLVVTESVRTESVTIPAFTGFNLISNVFPVGSTVQNSGLENALVSGATVSSSDVVWILDVVTGQYDRYYYRTPVFGGSPGWVDAVDNSAIPDNFELPSAFFIQRVGGDTNIDIAAPAEYSNL